MTLTLTDTTATPEPTLQWLPLSTLVLSPLNARQDVDAAEIAAMSDSIATIGLLQNLIGLERAPDQVEIVAGGKRLRALQLLAKHGFMPRADSGLDMNRIPVRITDSEAVALEWAGAENTARTQPHPADEVRAYRTLHQRGTPPRQIAMAFAQTESHVNRRLKLATLPEPVLDALREDLITLDQAAAFTLARTERQALDLLSAMRAAKFDQWNFSSRELRAKLTANRPGASDRRLAYIGLPAYTAAGGTLTLDLFAEASYVDDGDLLDQLATAKLTASAEDLQQAEGWAWATTTSDEWAMRASCDVLARTEGELTEADADEYDRLEELANADALDDAGQAALDALQARLDGDWTDEDRARGGIALWIKHDGTEGIQRGLLRRDDTPANTADNSGDDEAITTAPAPETGMPQNLRDDLRAIRLLSLQNALLENGELLRDLLMWQVSGGDLVPWQMPLAISVSRSQNMPGNLDGLIVPERLIQKDSNLARMEPTPEAFTAWRATPFMDRAAAQNNAIARAFHQPTGLLSVHLAQLLRPNPRTLWTPNARNFFGRCPMPMLNAIWAELVPADREVEHQTFASLTKKDKAAQLDKLFNLTDYREALGLSRDQNARIDAWLPEDLRWPEAETSDEAED